MFHIHVQLPNGHVLTWDEKDMMEARNKMNNCMFIDPSYPRFVDIYPVRLDPITCPPQRIENPSQNLIKDWDEWFAKITT